MSDKFLVIDGSSLIHRAFFALPPLTTRKGQHTGAVYGFLRMFHKLLQDVKPRWVVAAFDKSRKTFRNKLYADYKGQRKPTPPELKEQFPLCMEVLQSMGIAALELDDYEADDIIGTFAKKADPDVEVYIVTGDRDELQLLDDRTRVMYTKKGISDIKLYDQATFAEDYEGLVPLQLIDLKGLMGDTSDNIPGVPGVGPKTALKLIAEYGSVEKLMASCLERANDNLFDALDIFSDCLSRNEDGVRASGFSLVTAPRDGSACKRLFLFLKWMVRHDDVDPGGWTVISPRRLIMPTDTHIHAISLRLGLTKRKQADLKAAVEITGALARLCPDDPTRYDFVLTRFGIRDGLSVDELTRLAEDGA